MLSATSPSALPHWIASALPSTILLGEGSWQGGDLLSFLLVSNPRQFRYLLQPTWLSNILNVVLNLFCEWISFFPLYCKPLKGRANALGSFSLLYTGWHWEKHCVVFITLSAKLIEMRLLISSLGLHLQLNGWWCLGYGLINKFNKHELRIYDESEAVRSSGSTEMNGRSQLSKKLVV